ACLLAGGGARAQQQRFDYPAARAPATWANTDAGLPHHVVYTDGSVARVALLRLNPAGFGPSYAFGFFCTSPGAAPCADFLLGVAVVYCNSGALITSTTTGVPQVVWSANRGSPVGDGAAAELTAEGDLVLRSANGSVVWSAGTKGRSVAGVTIGSDGNLVLLDGRNATVWQSFDHPTDALLVGQSLRHGARLIANASTADWRDGRLYLAVEDDALSAYVNATPPQRYYTTSASARPRPAPTRHTPTAASRCPPSPERRRWPPSSCPPSGPARCSTCGWSTTATSGSTSGTPAPAGHRCSTCCASSRTAAARTQPSAARTACARTTRSAAAPTRPTSGRWTSGGPTAAASRRIHRRRPAAPRRRGGGRSTGWCRCRARPTSTTTPRACGPWRG
uniref:non-specific serine/threonine protein kinase n=1 Tax=Aegilops tauschii subsp. strangulata TaxID=200361 RepID=A0A453GQQ8_AEGTS